jgi:hypothetical protein
MIMTEEEMREARRSVKLFQENLADTFQVTGLKDPNYNCFAWAVHETHRNWSPYIGPGNYWPPGVPATKDLPTVLNALSTEGYVQCKDGNPESGYEKIVIYAKNGNASHAARLLFTGRWTSKMADEYLIEHLTPQELEGYRFGNIATYMKRP